MRCNDCLQLLSLYIDNELSDGKRHDVEQHLSKCPSCQQELTVQKNIRRLLLQQNSFSMPDKLHDKIMDRVKSIDIQKNVNTLTYKAYQKYIKPLATMAACFLILVSFVILKQGTYTNKAGAAAESNMLAEKDGIISEYKELDKMILNQAQTQEEETIIEEEPLQVQVAKQEQDSAQIQAQTKPRVQEQGQNQALTLEEDTEYHSLDAAVSSSSDIDNSENSQSMINSIAQSKESISEECWRVLVSDKETAYAQIKNLLSENNVVIEEQYINNSVNILFDAENKEDLLVRIKELNAVQDIVRENTSSNKIIIIIN